MRIYEIGPFSGNLIYPKNDSPKILVSSLLLLFLLNEDIFPVNFCARLQNTTFAHLLIFSCELFSKAPNSL